jgi:dihydroorotase (multifunctional complex type)
MMFDLVIVGGDVALPGRDPQRMTVATKDGKVAALLSPGEAIEAKRTLDVSGLLVLPGVLDVHLHLGHGKDIARPREKADAATETAAAAVGGVTTFIPYLMATKPFEEIFEDVRAVTEAGARIDFGYHFIISTEQQLAGVPAYASKYGAPSFKIFMNNRGGEGKRLGLPDIDDGFLFRLCQLSARSGGMVCPHPENIEVAWQLRKTVMEADPDGAGGLASWNATRPPFVEADAVQRAGLLARNTGSPLYIVHTSSAQALDAARIAREMGTQIYIETCPHYLTHDIGWTGKEIGKINPPLREASDREALWQGIGSGLVDTVATDHVHRDASSKEGGIWAASPGCPGLETLLPIMLSEGHHKRGIPIRRLVELLSERPARIMGLGDRKGMIAPGYDADLAIVDLNATTKVSNADVVSSAGYSIYDGWPLKGKVVHTLVRGEPVFENGALVDAAVGRGRYLHRRLQSAHSKMH